MKYTKILILMLMMLNSCTSLKEAGKVLRNEKTTTTDEFLVKKKQSLIFPPDYNSLPKPGELKVKKADETQKIKEMNILGNEGTEEDTKEAIRGALTLYLDFINLFLMLLRLMGDRR